VLHHRDGIVVVPPTPSPVSLYAEGALSSCHPDDDVLSFFGAETTTTRDGPHFAPAAREETLEILPVRLFVRVGFDTAYIAATSHTRLSQAATEKPIRGVESAA
jgi:hypothetical protein